MLDHAPTRAAVTAERAVLAALGGGCQVPIGALATVAADRLHLLGVVASPDGADADSRQLRRRRAGRGKHRRRARRQASRARRAHGFWKRCTAHEGPRVSGRRRTGRPGPHHSQRAPHPGMRGRSALRPPGAGRAAVRWRRPTPSGSTSARRNPTTPSARKKSASC